MYFHMSHDTVEQEVRATIEGIAGFTKQLHKQLTRENENDLLSSVHIHAWSVMLSKDPWFCTKDFFNIALQVDVNIAAARFKDIFEALSHVIGLKIANASFFKVQGIPVDSFKTRLRDDFASGLEELDFSKPEASSTINSWISDKTSGKLTTFHVENESSVAFLNTLHFKDNWAHPFSTDETVLSPFYLNDQNSIQVPTMKRKGRFSYLDDEYLDAKVLKLPFAGGKANLFIITPREGANIAEVEANMYDLHNFSMRMSETEVDVSLPKFKLDGNFELGDCLKKLGLEEMFHSCLGGVLEREELSCKEIRQKVSLEVNEAGAEAAAATLSTLAKYQDEKILPEDGLIVYEAKISSQVSNRFAKTKVVWRVKNTNTKAADANFKVILTDTAFITEFVMEIQGKSYKSYIKGKEEAKNIYNEAVSQGRSAGLVEAKTRDSREFTVSVNLEPDSAAVFSLTYEEMLHRLHDQYELVLNICPGQIVDDLDVEIRIDESRPLKFVKIPPMRTGNDKNTSELDKELDPKSTVEMITSKSAYVKFRPDPAQQKRMTHYLGNKAKEGLSGQFVVQYDVEREPLNGEVLLQDGYFIHFFAPNDLDPLPKHIVFVLDTSGSMQGRKIAQLKEAMLNILDDLRKEDMLSIIEFNSEVKVWDVASKKSTVLSEREIKDFREPFAYLKSYILADPQRVSEGIISTAAEVVQGISANGGTFMIGGLETALYVVSMGQKQDEGKVGRMQPIVVFLTDGEPNVGVASTDDIVELVTNLNSKDTVPIFSLSFGNYADKNFLRKLSLKNLGFSRHIYEAADASLQLQDFYKQISSPMLNDINFKYDGDVAEVTRMRFPIYFRGSELVVAGRCGGCALPASIDCWGPRGPLVIRSCIERPVTSLERLWAYLTVKQLLDERETAANPEELTKKAVDLALKYSFVTDVTSLVVVKPDEQDTTLSNRPTDTPPLYDGIVYNSLPMAQQVQQAARSGGPLVKRKMFCCKQMSIAQDADIQYFSGSGSHFQASGISPIGGRSARQDFSPPPDDDTLEQFQKKQAEEFKADRPFIVVLQVEIKGTSLILFQGHVFKPIY